MLHVTLCEVWTALLYPSTSCAVTVMPVPATGPMLGVTTYAVAAPGCVTMPTLPMKVPSFAMSVAAPAIVGVKVVPAWPLETLEVGGTKVPAGLALQVTVLPPPDVSALPYVSVSWALIVTCVPATGVPLVEVTTYFAAAPATVVSMPLVPV